MLESPLLNFENTVAKELVLSLATLLFFTLFYFVAKAFIRRIRVRHGLQVHRERILSRTLRSGLILLACLFLVLIWGIRQHSLWIFLSSIAGLVGVSIFASWSHLSNVFAAFLLFFTSRIRINETITLKDGDNSVTGQVKDMGMIFVFLEDKDGRRLTIPNNLIIQKTVIRENTPKI